MRFFYDFLWHLAAPLVLFRVWLRGRRDGLRGNFLRQRLGGWRRGEVDLWIHAVSLGETLAAEPLIRALLAARPGLRVLFSTSTAAGFAAAHRFACDQIRPAWMPLDLRWVVRRFLKRARPRSLVVVEHDLWPNLILESRARGMQLALVSARLSAASARGYARAPEFFGTMLQAFDLIFCQGEEDIERFARLGVAAERLRLGGNLKRLRTLPEKSGQVFSFPSPGSSSSTSTSPSPPPPPPPPPSPPPRSSSPHRRFPVWIAASIHAGEEQAVLRMHQALCCQIEGLRLWIAPRHLRRLERVEAALSASGLRYAKLSEACQQEAAAVEVLLIDTEGDLAALYASADLAFVGGALVPRGGHNLIEPAHGGCPMVVGPHCQNWKEEAQELAAAGALRMGKDVAQLQSCLLDWLLDPQGLQAAGEAARKTAELWMERQQLLLQKMLEALLLQLPDSGIAKFGE